MRGKRVFRKLVQFPWLAALLLAELGHMVSGFELSGNPRADIEGADGPIHAILITNGIAYVGGDFTTLNGKNGMRLAALDVKSGLPEPWAPNPSGTIQALAFSGSHLYVGGRFDEIGGERRTTVAQLESSTGRATGWDPRLENGTQGSPGVNGVVALEDRVLVAGDFTRVAGENRDHIAAVHPKDGRLLDWKPADRGPVSVLAANERFVYVAVRSPAAGTTVWAVNLTNDTEAVELEVGQTGTVRPFPGGGGGLGYYNPSLITALALSGNTLFVLTYSIHKLPRRNFAVFSPTGFSLLHIEKLKDVSLRLKLFGNAKETYVIQGSQDFQTWSPLGSHTLTNIWASLPVPNEPRLLQRFFRAVQTGAP